MNDVAIGRPLELRLVPWPLLLAAAPFLLIAALVWWQGALHGGAWLLVAVPVVLALFFEVTTVTVDQGIRAVTVRRARPWGSGERRFSFDELAAVAVEASTSGRSRTYGVVFALRSGERIPLRTATSSGRASKDRLARTLAEAVSQGCSSPVPTALDGTVRESSSGSTHGVEWTLELVDRGGGSELTRFFTEAVRLDDGFLLVTPASTRATLPPLGGVLGALMRAFVQQHLRALELAEADVPHLERAATMQHDRLTAAGFTASTSSPQAALRWLEAGAAAVLEDWQRQPLLHRGRAVEPLLVLGPRGLRVLFRACLREERDRERVRDLGLALARIAR